jgi:hypothetical protein
VYIYYRYSAGKAVRGPAQAINVGWVAPLAEVVRLTV